MIEYNLINIINLETRPERLEGFLKEADFQGFGVRVWEGEVVKYNAKMGICRSHKRIVQYAKDNNLKWVAIAEDDCRFFGEQPGAWKYFVDNMPEDWDLWLAMYYACDKIEGNRIMDSFSGMTLFFVNQRFYDVFLSIPDDSHIDRELGKHADQYKFIVCDQVCAEQDGSRSDNTKTTTNYRPFLVGRKIFGDVKID